jgi:quercetin dioxygenase-like cupin family protein
MTRSRLALWTLLVFAGGVLAGVVLAGAVLAGAAAAPGQPPRMWTEVLLRLTTDEIPRRAALQVNDDRWDPGAGTGRHQHPGPTIIYVLEGELSEWTPQGQTTLRAGQAVWRPARHEHDVRNASGRPARALAMHLDPAR